MQKCEKDKVFGSRPKAASVVCPCSVEILLGYGCQDQTDQRQYACEHIWANQEQTENSAQYDKAPVFAHHTEEPAENNYQGQHIIK